MFNQTKAARVTLIIMSLGIVVASTQFAAAGWAENHPRRAEVNARLARENARINQERREGEISAGEAHALHAQDRFMRDEERFDAAHDGSHITRGEQRALNRQENILSREIGR